MALLTLGDLAYRNGNCKSALYYYKKASVKDKKDYSPFIKEAMTYQKLNNIKKAKDLYTKILKTHSDSWEAYYNIALLDDTKTTIYLKKSLAVNPFFENGWIELSKQEISKENYDVAKKYLSNAFYIDENDFRYYYYQGLVFAKTGDYIQAKYNLKKCLKLNGNCKDASSLLSEILRVEDS